MTRCTGKCVCSEPCSLEEGHHPAKPFADAKGRAHICETRPTLPLRAPLPEAEARVMDGLR